MAALSDGKPKDWRSGTTRRRFLGRSRRGCACELRFRVRGRGANQSQGECPRRRWEGSLAHGWGRSTAVMAFRRVVPDVEAGPGATHDHETGRGIARGPATPGPLHRFQPRPQHPDQLRRLFPPDRRPRRAQDAAGRRRFVDVKVLGTTAASTLMITQVRPRFHVANNLMSIGNLTIRSGQVGGIPGRSGRAGRGDDPVSSVWARSRLVRSGGARRSMSTVVWARWTLGRSTLVLAATS